MLCEEMGNVPLCKKTDVVTDGQKSENFVGRATSRTNGLPCP